MMTPAETKAVCCESTSTGTTPSTTNRLHNTQDIHVDGRMNEIRLWYNENTNNNNIGNSAITMAYHAIQSDIQSLTQRQWQQYQVPTSAAATTTPLQSGYKHMYDNITGFWECLCVSVHLRICRTTRTSCHILTAVLAARRSTRHKLSRYTWMRDAHSTTAG